MKKKNLPNASEYKNFIEKYCKINELEIYYECENCEPGKSEETAILFIHGWTANRLRLHGPFINLKMAGFSVFRLDLRGHGWSQKIAVEDYSIDQMVNDVDQFCRKIIIEKFGFSKVILLGHSMGGCICQEIAINKPDYLEKLILVSTSSQFSYNFWQFLKLKIYAKMYKKWFWKYYNRKKEGHAPLGLEHFPMWLDIYNTKGRDLFTSYRATVQGLEELAYFDAREGLPSLKIPVLIICGADDIDAHPEHSKKIDELIPNSQLHIIKGANHDVLIGKPEISNKIILQFIKN